MLTPEIIKKLREPFAVENLRWKIQTNPKEGAEYAVVVVFVDARSVAAHLDDVVGGQWHTAYRQPPITVGHPALECQLTICGVTRSDVGTVEPSRTASGDTKDLYSDALKRAAVQFGVGAFLYRFPNVQAKCQQYGKSWYLTPDAARELKDLTRHVIEGKALPQYRNIKVRNYDPDSIETVTLGHDDEPEVEQPVQQPARPQPPVGKAPCADNAFQKAIDRILAGDTELAKKVRNTFALTEDQIQRLIAAETQAMAGAA